MAANYNIEVEQGETFLFHFQYLGRGSTGIDVSGYTGQMQIRRSPFTSSKVVEVLNSGVTYGTTAGTGGFLMNRSATGGSQTGGVYISLDAVTTSFIPSGQNFYDIELVKGATVDKILKGRLDCNREVTR
tara:strand:+ start:234 stop:623 length:390 start_codon:yes stop_codon:yes gene_type:complete